MSYERPEVLDYGSLTDLTAGQKDGNFTDKFFNIMTPKKDLTFSG